jgi:hypothetical protein
MSIEINWTIEDQIFAQLLMLKIAAIKSGKIYLGLFINKEEAARAYNSAAKKYHGEYARLNVL